jgi:hypothetical protein
LRTSGFLVLRMSRTTDSVAMVLDVDISQIYGRLD